MKRKWPYLYILPAVFVIIFFKGYPLANVFVYSFTNWEGYGNLHFIGLNNYLKLFTNLRFWDVLSHNGILLLVIPVEVFLGLFVATLLYERLPGWKLYQIGVFLPVILPVVVCGVVWTYFYQWDGLINVMLKTVGLGDLTRLWLVDPRYALFAVMVVIIWKDTGFAIILFLSRLLAIDSSLFDAAKMDGASKIQIFFYITIPQLWTLIEVYIVLTVISIFNSIFSYIYVLTAGGPGYHTTVAEYYIFIKGFEESKLGYASAVAVILFTITLVFIIIMQRVLSKEM